jgi:hypothetical protein
MAEDVTLSARTPSALGAIQEQIVKQMQDFSAKNPQIAEALEVMNMSVADYLQAMEAIRGGQTVSCSTFGDAQPSSEL